MSGYIQGSTSPQGLRFATGGVVLDSDVGVEIGLLVADDPDTVGELDYRVAWPDSAWFEITGRTLRLRPGVDLHGLAGMQRDVLIEVSDGLNLAAFAITVAVLPSGPRSTFAIQDGTLGADWLVGRDRMDGGTGNDTLDGGDGADLVNGDVGDDLLRAQGGAGDQLRGGVGADTLDAASGDGGGSLLLGGPDDDVYLIDSRRDEVIEVPGGGIDVVHAVLDGGSYALPCTAPGFLDTRLHYAARLRLVSRRAARASSGLR